MANAENTNTETSRTGKKNSQAQTHAWDPYKCIKFVWIWGVVVGLILLTILISSFVRAAKHNERVDHVHSNIQENWFMDDRFEE